MPKGPFSSQIPMVNEKGEKRSFHPIDAKEQMKFGWKPAKPEPAAEFGKEDAKPVEVEVDIKTKSGETAGDASIAVPEPVEPKAKTKTPSKKK